MDREQLSRQLIDKNKMVILQHEQTEATEMRTIHCDARKEAKRHQRIAPIYELAARNRNVFERLCGLEDLVELDELESVGIIIGPTPKTTITPNHMTVCRINRFQYGIGVKRENRMMELVFFHIDGEGELIAGIRDYGSMPTYEIYEDGVIEGPGERTFEVASEYYWDEWTNDELVSNFTDATSDRTIEPINFFIRASFLRRASVYIAELEATARMLKVSADNEVLNPCLAQKLNY